MHHRRLQVHICRLDAFHANLLLTTFVHMFLYAKKMYPSFLLLLSIKTMKITQVSITIIITKSFHLLHFSLIISNHNDNVIMNGPVARQRHCYL